MAVDIFSGIVCFCACMFSFNGILKFSYEDLEVMNRAKKLMIGRILERDFPVKITYSHEYQARPLLKQALEDSNYDAVVDPKLQDYDSNEMNRMICCAAACVRHIARFRPRMSQVILQVPNILLLLLNTFVCFIHSMLIQSVMASLLPMMSFIN